MSALELLVKAHEGIRWLVLLAIVVGVWGLVRGWWSAAQYQRRRGVWEVLYTVLLDVQLALGVLLFILLAEAAWPPLGHPLAMILAIGAAHVGMRLSRRESAPARWTLLAFGLSILFVLVGLTFVPRGFGF